MDDFKQIAIKQLLYPGNGLNSSLTQILLQSMKLWIMRLKQTTLINGNCTKNSMEINYSVPQSIYKLATVTHGQKASFFAIGCLFELVKLYEKSHQEMSNIIYDDMYCDDPFSIYNCQSL